MRPTLVFAANVQRYSCGCIAQWEYIGAFAYLREYHIIPCFDHTTRIKEMEKIAEQDWNTIMGEPTQG